MLLQIFTNSLIYLFILATIFYTVATNINWIKENKKSLFISLFFILIFFILNSAAHAQEVPTPPASLPNKNEISAILQNSFSVFTDAIISKLYLNPYLSGKLFSSITILIATIFLSLEIFRLYKTFFETFDLKPVLISFFFLILTLNFYTPSSLTESLPNFITKSSDNSIIPREKRSLEIILFNYFKSLSKIDSKTFDLNTHANLNQLDLVLKFENYNLQICKKQNIKTEDCILENQKKYPEINEQTVIQIQLEYESSLSCGVSLTSINITDCFSKVLGFSFSLQNLIFNFFRILNYFFNIISLFIYLGLYLFLLIESLFIIILLKIISPILCYQPLRKNFFDLTLNFLSLAITPLLAAIYIYIADIILISALEIFLLNKAPDPLYRTILGTFVISFIFACCQFLKLKLILKSPKDAKSFIRFRFSDTSIDFSKEKSIAKKLITKGF